MRMSCNGCRVLRKGCSENCSIRPCLQWIKSPEAQANATVFLAKFYGRAGLMNLINAGPENLRPAVFRSLLYEACGRIVNPIYGSVGLLWSGSWQLCQAAVEAVLKGSPITPMASDTAFNGHAPPLKAYDIRHVSKDNGNGGGADINQGFRDNNNNSKSRRKRSAGKLEKGSSATVAEKEKHEMSGSASHESSLSHQSELAVADNSTESGNKETTESCSMASGETGPTVNHDQAEDEVGLELTLGIAEPVSRERHVVPVKKRRAVGGYGTCEEDVMLGLRSEIQGKKN